MADDRDESGESGDKNMIERRVDRRRRLMEQADSPTLRRIVGGVIIAATLYYGLFGSRSFERRAANKTAADESSGQLKQPVLTLPNLSLSATPAPVESRGPVEKVSPLSADTIATISECTKGVDSLRLIDLKAAVLDQILAPALSGKRRLELQNVRIQIPSGREWRLHASPEGQAGELRFKLFQVAKDGLPESIPFPTEISALKGAAWSPEAIEQFKKLGRVIEEENHEIYSFRDKTGIQMIRVNGAILDAQVFMGNRFLACSRDRARGNTLCQCKKTGD